MSTLSFVMEFSMYSVESNLIWLVSKTRFALARNCVTVSYSAQYDTKGSKASVLSPEGGGGGGSKHYVKRNARILAEFEL